MFSAARLLYSLLLVSLLLHLQPAQAQGLAAVATAPHGYEFMTVTSIESGIERESKLLLSPAFEGQSEIPLANASLYYLSKDDFQKLGQNTATINQLLSRLTVAGWELFQVYSLAPTSGTGHIPPMTRYLFRKAKS